MDPQIILQWYITNKTYSVLKFIISNKDKPAYLLTVLDSLHVPITVDMKMDPPGTDYAIYRQLIAGAPQPVPELKCYSSEVQEKFKTHECWVGWAGIFDRKLTKSQRVILSHYRAAFLCLLVNGFVQEAYAILKLAEHPVDAPGQLTGKIMYSKEVLKEFLKN